MTTVNPIPTGIPDDAAERDQARRLAERYPAHSSIFANSASTPNSSAASQRK